MPPAITRKQLEKLAQKVKVDHPRPEDVIAFRSAIEKIPELIEYQGNLAIQCQYLLMGSIQMNAFSRQFIEAGIENLRHNLGDDNPSMLEKLLMDQIVLCHLRLYLWEYAYHSSASSASDLSQANNWENLIGMAQKRYFRAIETLARVRKTGQLIQVNIATEGGQQVNINSLSNYPQSTEKENGKC